jgi:hypothetical protein
VLALLALPVLLVPALLALLALVLEPTRWYAVKFCIAEGCRVSVRWWG